MNDADRRRTADELGDGFTRLAVALAHVDRRRDKLDGGHEGDDMTPLDRMRFSFQGHPRAARYDGDSDTAPAYQVQTGDVDDGWRSMHSDPTGNAACRPDRAAADLKAHDKDVRAAVALLERMTARLERYGPARAAGDAERALLARENVVPEPGCANCAKFGHWQRIFRGALCDFCYRWSKDTGSEPAKRECDMHADGKTVRRPDVNHVSRKGTAA